MPNRTAAPPNRAQALRETLPRYAPGFQGPRATGAAATCEKHPKKGALHRSKISPVAPTPNCKATTRGETRDLRGAPCAISPARCAHHTGWQQQGVLKIRRRRAPHTHPTMAPRPDVHSRSRVLGAVIAGVVPRAPVEGTEQSTLFSVNQMAVYA